MMSTSVRFGNGRNLVALTSFTPSANHGNHSDFGCGFFQRKGSTRRSPKGSGVGKDVYQITTARFAGW